jgi:hypothetical protein
MDKLLMKEESLSIKYITISEMGGVVYDYEVMIKKLKNNNLHDVMDESQ